MPTPRGVYSQEVLFGSGSRDSEQPEPHNDSLFTSPEYDGLGLPPPSLQLSFGGGNMSVGSRSSSSVVPQDWMGTHTPRSFALEGDSVVGSGRGTIDFDMRSMSDVSNSSSRVSDLASDARALRMYAAVLEARQHQAMLAEQQQRGYTSTHHGWYDDRMSHHISPLFYDQSLESRQRLIEPPGFREGYSSMYDHWHGAGGPRPARLDREDVEYASGEQQHQQWFARMSAPPARGTAPYLNRMPPYEQRIPFIRPRMQNMEASTNSMRRINARPAWGEGQQHRGSNNAF